MIVTLCNISSYNFLSSSLIFLINQYWLCYSSLFCAMWLSVRHISLTFSLQFLQKYLKIHSVIGDHSERLCSSVIIYLNQVFVLWNRLIYVGSSFCFEISYFYLGIGYWFY